MAMTSVNILNMYNDLVKFQNYSNSPECWRLCGGLEALLLHYGGLDLKEGTKKFNKKEKTITYKGWFGKEKMETRTETYVEYIKRCAKDYLSKELENEK